MKITFWLILQFYANISIQLIKWKTAYFSKPEITYLHLLWCDKNYWEQGGQEKTLKHNDDFPPNLFSKGKPWWESAPYKYIINYWKKMPFFTQKFFKIFWEIINFEWKLPILSENLPFYDKNCYFWDKNWYLGYEKYFETNWPWNFSISAWNFSKFVRLDTNHLHHHVRDFFPDPPSAGKAKKKQYLGYIQIIKSSFQVHLSHRGAFKKLPAF